MKNDKDIIGSNIKNWNNVDTILSNNRIIAEGSPNNLVNNEIAKSHYFGNFFQLKKQLNDCNKTLEGIRSKSSSSTEAALILENYLTA